MYVLKYMLLDHTWAALFAHNHLTEKNFIIFLFSQQALWDIHAMP